jgi:hypothetical protein
MKPIAPAGQLDFAVGEHGPFLATRTKAATMRGLLEERLRAVSTVNQVTIDLTGTEAMTISFADEFIGRFYVSLAAGDLPVGGVQLIGLNEETRETIAICLERRKLLAVDGDRDTLLGDAEFLLDSYTHARRLGSFRAADLAQELGTSLPNTNNRLKRLLEAGALRRDRITDPQRGGKEFIYTVPGLASAA